jgi:hypothetical protein
MSAKRYAVLENETVVNVIVADSKFIKEHYSTAIECSDEVSIGWCHDGENFYIPVYEVEDKLNNEVVDEAETI